MFGEYDIEDPRSLEFGLTAFPGQGDMAQMIPMPPGSVPKQAKLLHELGYRHHPEKMTKFPIPGEQPGMGWMNVNSFVSKEEYEKRIAESKVPGGGDADGDMGAAMKILEAISPALAEHISELSPEEAKAAVAEQEAQIPGLLAKLAEARELMEKENGSSS